MECLDMGDSNESKNTQITIAIIGAVAIIIAAIINIVPKLTENLRTPEKIQPLLKSTNSSKDIDGIPVEAEIIYPPNMKQVGRNVTIKGYLQTEYKDVSAYLIVKPIKYKQYYPQGKIHTDPSHKFMIKATYGSLGYEYETFIVVTNDKEASVELENPHYKSLGTSVLPKNIKIVGNKTTYKVVNTLD